MRRAAAILAVASLLGACGAAAPGGPPLVAGAAAEADVGALGERSSQGGGVDVVATWISADPPAVALTLDTHSVDLDRFDLKSLAALRLDGGPWMGPAAADVPRGGHHRAGTVTFASVPAAAFDAARLIELRLSDVGATHLLRWERGR